MDILSAGRRLLQFADKRRPKAPETREIASTLDGRDITRGYISPLMLLPPQDDILRHQGGGDLALYKDILSDAQVGAVFQQRRLSLTRTEWQVIPGGERRLDRQAATLLEETLDRIRWDAVCNGMHYGVFYGHAVAECLWAREGARVALSEVRVRDRARFGFDADLRLRLRTFADPVGELLPDRKFWHFRTGADHDDEPYGLGLAHWLYWPVLFKRANIKFWLIAAEKFGSPTAVGMFPPNATPDEQQKLLATLRAIQTDAGLIVPEGMKIDLLEATRAGSADYAALCEYMDRAIAKIVLGQTMTSEAVGGQYKADVQDRIKDDLVKADADLICDTFNRGPVRWLIDWNLPGAAYPKIWREVEEEEDLGSRAARERNIFDMGYRPTLKHIEATYGGDWEPRGQADAGADFAESDETQSLIDAEGARDPGWDAAMEALLAPLFDALREGLTPEQILGRMDAWYPAMDDEQLIALLTRAIVAAETHGRLEAAA